MEESENPLVSIVTVSFNSDKTIERTIKSVINQTYSNIEYIIIDGGSQDSTVSIIKSYSKYLKYWVSEKDSGIYHAMNKGILASSGDIIGIINSDDWLNYDSVEKIVKAVKGIDGDFFVIHGKIARYDKYNKFVGEHYPKKIPWYHFISTPFKHPSMFVAHKVYEKIGLFDEHIGLSADYDFMLRVIRNHCQTHFLNTVITNMQNIGISSGGFEQGPFRMRVEVVRRHTSNIVLAILICSVRVCYKAVRGIAKK